MFCFKHHFLKGCTGYILFFDQVCGQLVSLCGLYSFLAGITGNFHIGNLDLVSLLGHSANPGARELYFYYIPVKIHFLTVLGFQADIKCDHITDPGFLYGWINLALCRLDQGFLVAHFLYQKFRAYRKDAFLCAHGYNYSTYILLVGKCRMLGHFFQRCHNFQILCYFLCHIDKLIPGQFSCLSFNCRCIQSLQFYTIGGYGTDHEAYLRIHCKIQIFTLIDCSASLDLGRAQWVHSIVHTELSCHSLDTGQVFGGYLVSSCIGRAPDGYGIVGFSV